ncbi:MauE/DoxX family redox-associated membrane protein [Streptomyces sp. NPDC101175]|uniref:MauE/DoxX family redox-associated membrane protein n=1 Tax=Streptomyces sp. NPDC101175 TaxID=3366123 RepID=UPI0038337514
MIAVSAALGLLLIVAAAPKLRAAAAFGRTVEAYRVLPPGLARLVGRVLPWAELLVGAALVTGPVWRLAASAAALMFGAFTLGLTVNLLRGRTELSCGCFSFGAVDESARRIGWFHAARAAVLTALAAGTAAVGVPSVELADRIVQLVVAGGVVAVGVVVAELRTVLTTDAGGLDVVLGRARDTLREAG